MSSTYEVEGKLHGKWVEIPLPEQVNAQDAEAIHRLAVLNRNRYDGTRVLRTVELEAEEDGLTL